MKKENIVLSLLRKVVCSFLCINKNAIDLNIKNKSKVYLDEFIKYYELYYNNKEFMINNYIEIIDFCNECYADFNVFDYAEDIEYGVKELMKVMKGGDL